MTWQERLASLRGIGQWELALLVGLDILQTAKSAAAGTLAAVHLWRGEGKGAEPHQVWDAPGVGATPLQSATNAAPSLRRSGS